MHFHMLLGRREYHQNVPTIGSNSIFIPDIDTILFGTIYREYLPLLFNEPTNCCAARSLFLAYHWKNVFHAMYNTTVTTVAIATKRNKLSIVIRRSK